MAIKLCAKGEEIVYKTKRREEGVECDICGKFIAATNEYLSDKDARKYFEVTTGHHDWGNDSCESVEHKDVCPDCINKFIVEYLHTGSETAYIEIETTYTYPRFHWDD